MSESKGESKGESKESKGDDAKGSMSSVVDLVQEFCLSSEMEREFEDFAEEYKSEFSKSLEFKEGGEHPLEFYNIYAEYLRRFERKIENFIVGTGYAVKDFYDECRKVLEDEEVFGTRRFFVETLLATSEYECFFVLMKSEMYRINNKTTHK